MAKENETIADIIAEMRGDGHTGPADALEWVRIKLEYYADRLEAAHKRERGDCAKLREAVKAVVDVGYPHNFQREAPHIRGYCYDITRAIEKCFAALAAPPRNCDVGTVKEQFARFRKFCKKDSMDSLAATAYCAYECPCGNSYDCKLAWAQMPYEEGGAK